MEHMSAKWSVVALDMHELMAQVSKNPFKHLKSIQFCANMKARGAFTSDNKCGLASVQIEYLHLSACLCMLSVKLHALQCTQARLDATDIHELPRYSLNSLPREMVLSSALDPAEFDFTWLPAEPATQENAQDVCNSASMPKVQHGHVKSPIWEGQGAARTEFPNDPPSPRKPSPERDYTRNYPDR